MDCTFKTKEGKFNFRVAAIIKNGNKILMAHNPDDESCYYSVGGRVKMNETVEDAVIREIKEETGLNCEIERMGFIHENFFTNYVGVKFHEISIYFYIKITDEILNIKNGHLTKDGPQGEFLEWIDITENHSFNIYPEFYINKLNENTDKITHIVTRE